MGENNIIFQSYYSILSLIGGWQRPKTLLILFLILMKLMLMTITTQRQRCIAASGRSSFPAGFVSYPELQQKNEEKLKETQGLSPVPKPQSLSLSMILLHLLSPISVKNVSNETQGLSLIPKSYFLSHLLSPTPTKG